jgi:hypothetical protein
MKKEKSTFMTKPGDLPVTKKTIHELAKEFPEKTYRDLEKYRDADRQEEASRIPLTESQQKQEELEPIGMGHNHPPEEKGICIMGEMRKDREFEKEIDYHRYWKDMYEKEHKLRQEAGGETSIVKGIGQNSPEMKALKKEIENLKWIKDQDYIFLVDENKKLHAELKKFKNGAVDRARKAGL